MPIENTPLTSADIEVYSLSKALDLSIDLRQFKCENEEFNDYLYYTAYEDDKRKIGKVWLFTTHEKKPIGFATLAMSQISKHFDKYFVSMTAQTNIPALIIGQMARHVDYKGRGVGILMRDWILNKTLRISENIGCRLTILQAVEAKIELYKGWGFKSIEEEYRNTMFIDLLNIPTQIKQGQP